MKFWTFVARVLDRLPRVQAAIRYCARAVREARARRREHKAPHSQRHLWNARHHPNTCMYCFTPRTDETEHEACGGSAFFRRMVVE